MTDIVNDPHPFEEDPEEHLGDETPDPWDDPNQTDWPTPGVEESETTEEKSE